MQKPPFQNVFRLTKLSIEKRLLFLLLIVFTLILLQSNPLVESWNANPSVYLYFEITFLLFVIFELFRVKNKSIEITIIDLVMLSLIFFISIHEIFIEGFRSFFHEDESLSNLSIICIYVVFRQVAKVGRIYIFLIISLILLFELLLCTAQIIKCFEDESKFASHVYGSFKNTGILAIVLNCSLPSLLAVKPFLRSIKLYKYLLTTSSIAVFLITCVVGSRTGLILLMIIGFYQCRFLIKTIYNTYLADSYILKITLSLILIGLLFGLTILKYPSFLGRIFIWKLVYQCVLKSPFLAGG